MSDSSKDSKFPPDTAGGMKLPSLFGFLRRGPLRNEGLQVQEEHELWRAHGEVERAAAETGRDLSRVRAGLAKERALNEEAAERVRVQARRAQELLQQSQHLTDGYQRAQLLSLSVGLEAARQEGVARTSLEHAAEQLRVLAEDGAERTKQVHGTAKELSDELAKTADTVGQVVALHRELHLLADNADRTAAEANRSLAELRERLKKSTGSDPETVRAIGELTEHARALVSGLGSLTGRVPERLLVAALRPVLEPLLRLLASEDDGG